MKTLVHRQIKELVPKLQENKNRIYLSMVFLGVYLTIFFSFRIFGVNSDEAYSWIGGYGPYAFVIIYVFQILISMSPIPDGGLAIFAVLFLGPYKAFLVIILGMFTASMIHFTIAKKYGKTHILKKFPKLEQYVDLIKEDSSIEKLIMYRFFALVSFDVIAYLAGIAGVPIGKYVVSALLGFIPIILSSIFLAIGVFADTLFEILFSWLLAGVVMFAILFLARLTKLNDTMKAFNF